MIQFQEKNPSPITGGTEALTSAHNSKRMWTVIEAIDWPHINMIADYESALIRHVFANSHTWIGWVLEKRE